MIRTLATAVLAAVLSLGTLSAFAATPAVDVNKATQAELESVKGIGPGLSGKILQARQAGTFKDWNDLVDRVGGVGPGNAKRFSEHGLTVGGASFDGTATKTEAKKPARADKADKTEKAAKPAGGKAMPQG